VALSAGSITGDVSLHDGARMIPCIEPLVTPLQPATMLHLIGSAQAVWILAANSLRQSPGQDGNRLTEYSILLSGEALAKPTKAS